MLTDIWPLLEERDARSWHLADRVLAGCCRSQSSQTYLYDLTCGSGETAKPRGVLGSAALGRRCCIDDGGWDVLARDGSTVDATASHWVFSGCSWRVAATTIPFGV